MSRLGDATGCSIVRWARMYPSHQFALRCTRSGQVWRLLLLAFISTQPACAAEVLPVGSSSEALDFRGRSPVRDRLGMGDLDPRFESKLPAGRFGTRFSTDAQRARSSLLCQAAMREFAMVPKVREVMTPLGVSAKTLADWSAVSRRGMDVHCSPYPQDSLFEAYEQASADLGAHVVEDVAAAFEIAGRDAAVLVRSAVDAMDQELAVRCAESGRTTVASPEEVFVDCRFSDPLGTLNGIGQSAVRHQSGANFAACLRRAESILAPDCGDERTDGNTADGDDTPENPESDGDGEQSCSGNACGADWCPAGSQRCDEQRSQEDDHVLVERTVTHYAGQTTRESTEQSSSGTVLARRSEFWDETRDPANDRPNLRVTEHTFGLSDGLETLGERIPVVGPDIVVPALRLGRWVAALLSNDPTEGRVRFLRKDELCDPTEDGRPVDGEASYIDAVMGCVCDALVADVNTPLGVVSADSPFCASKKNLETDCLMNPYSSNDGVREECRDILLEAATDPTARWLAEMSLCFDKQCPSFSSGALGVADNEPYCFCEEDVRFAPSAHCQALTCADGSLPAETEVGCACVLVTAPEPAGPRTPFGP